MNRILLSVLLSTFCSLANAQWEHLADLRVPAIYPFTYSGQSVAVSGGDGEIYLTTDQGQSFNPLPFAGLPSTFIIWNSRLLMFPDYYLILSENQLYRLLPDSATWEPLGMPIDTSPNISYRDVTRQGTQFIVSGIQSLFDTITWELAAEISKNYRSFDEGNTWIPIETGLPGFDFSWSTVLDSVVLAQNGVKDSTYFSTDGGASWQAVTYPPGLCQALNIRSRTGANLLAQDTCQQLFFSSDRGKSWVLPSGLDSVPFYYDWDGLTYFNGELLQSGGSLILHPYRSYFQFFDSLYRSNDHGVNWASIPFKPYDSSDDGNASEMVVTPNGTLLYFAKPELYASMNQGDTWTMVLTAAPIDGSLQVTDSLVFLMGKGGFYVSTDQGLTWTDRSQNCPDQVQEIGGLSAKGSLLVIRGNDPGGCNTYVSPDNGATWRKSPICGLTFVRNTTQGIFACTLDESIIYEGGGPFTLFKSTDEGVTWKGVPLEREGQLDFLQPAGEKLLVMGPAIQVAEPARLMVSDVQGESWSLSSNGIPPGSSMTCAAFDTVTGLIYTANRYFDDIYVSSDQGQTWEVSALGLRGASMVADNGNVCIMAKDKVHVSHDSGATWATVADTVLVGNRDAENALVLANGNLIMGGRNVFISQDWGETWTTFNEGLPPGTVAYDLVRDEQYLYTASLDRGIYRRPISDLTSSTRPEASATLALEVFPNPSLSGVFDLKIGSTGDREVQLFIVDASGKTIWHGVQSGNRERINLSTVPSGVYWLRAVSDKETAVRKLVKAGG